MVGTLSTVIDKESVLMLLWKHECTRVFSDRLTIQSDKKWFDEGLIRVVNDILGEKYVNMLNQDPTFVDFMRFVAIICEIINTYCIILKMLRNTNKIFLTPEMLQNQPVKKVKMQT